MMNDGCEEIVNEIQNFCVYFLFVEYFTKLSVTQITGLQFQYPV